MKYQITHLPTENTYHGWNGTHLNLYKNVTKSDCTEYARFLLSQGFEKTAENENGGNFFVSLEKDIRVNLYYTPHDKTLRLTVDKTAPFIETQPEHTEGVKRYSFFCFENDHTLIDCGMCLLFQLPDSSFFIVDSGHYFQMNDNDRLYQFMRKRTPEGKNIRINGWLVTHTHTDHVSKLMDFLKYNCENVSIDAFYINFLPDEYPDNDWGTEERIFDLRLKKMLKETKVPIITLHSGQRFYIGELCFDVLCTSEDIFPDKIEDFNDSSLVVSASLRNSKVLIPGDASAKESKILEERFNKNLSCDIVQVSHHGHFGLSRNAYELINAKVAVFPVTRIKFDEEYRALETNRRIVEIAERTLISSDGTIEIPLPYDERIIRYKDETFEDFKKIRRLWGYDYTKEYKQNLFDIFRKYGGDLEDCILPVDINGTFLD